MQETCKAKPMTREEIAEAIRSSTFAVFSTMLDLQVEAGEVIVGEAAARNRAGLIALLGFAGEWAGSGILYCEAPFALRMASQLLMTEYSAIDEEVLDAVAEVANMIVGNVKTVLEQRLGAMGLSTPTVIYGRNFETRSVGSREWVTVPFSCAAGVMGVQVSIVPNARKQRPLPNGTLGGAACPYCGSYTN